MLDPTISAKKITFDLKVPIVVVYPGLNGDSHCIVSYNIKEMNWVFLFIYLKSLLNNKSNRLCLRVRLGKRFYR